MGPNGKPSLAIGPIRQPIGFHRVPYKLASKKISFPQAPKAREKSQPQPPKGPSWARLSLHQKVWVASRHQKVKKALVFFVFFTKTKRLCIFSKSWQCIFIVIFLFFSLTGAIGPLYFSFEKSGGPKLGPPAPLSKSMGAWKASEG